MNVDFSTWGDRFGGEPFKSRNACDWFNDPSEPEQDIRNADAACAELEMLLGTSLPDQELDTSLINQSHSVSEPEAELIFTAKWNCEPTRQRILCKAGQHRMETDSRLVFNKIELQELDSELEVIPRHVLEKLESGTVFSFTNWLTLARVVGWMLVLVLFASNELYGAMNLTLYSGLSFASEPLAAFGWSASFIVTGFILIRYAEKSASDNELTWLLKFIRWAGFVGGFTAPLTFAYALGSVHGSSAANGIVSPAIPVEILTSIGVGLQCFTLVAVEHFRSEAWKVVAPERMQGNPKHETRRRARSPYTRAVSACGRVLIVVGAVESWLKADLDVYLGRCLSVRRELIEQKADEAQKRKKMCADECAAIYEKYGL